MNALKLPHDCWVFVADGKKALILRNEGDEVYPNLVMHRHFEQDNPPTREQGTDRPGRLNDAMGNRSAVENTDFHKLDEDRFAESLAGELYQAAHAGAFRKLVIVAPPRFLGVLRPSLHKEVTDRVIAEIDKDLAGAPVDQIERHLTGA